MKQQLESLTVRLIQTDEKDLAVLGDIARELGELTAGQSAEHLNALAPAARKLATASRSGKRVAGALRAVNAALETALTAESQDAAELTDAPAFAMDAELLESFAAESLEYLQAAESALIELESNPDASEAINVVFRSFHTIKGTSAFLGLDDVSHFAHDAESLFSRARDREILIAGPTATLALQAVDALRALINTTGQPGSESARAAAHAIAEQLARADRIAETAVVPEASPTPASGPALEVSNTQTAAENWTRIRTERLDALMDMIGELVIAQSMVAQDGEHARDRNSALGRKIEHAGKIVRELQDLSISLRMVPLKPVFQKMQRVLRDAAQKCGKQVELITEGAETEVDRNMVDVLGDPLVHMIRNAVDHAIEPAMERNAGGKTETGRVVLRAYHAGGNVVVEVEDDGRGIDPERVRAKALARGLLEPERHYTEQDLLQLLFAPGFSTSDKVTDLSGRGVGLDVVRRNIESLRGRIDIDSRKGNGTRFTIRMPLTLAMTDGMLVRIGSERFIVPTSSIHLSFRPERRHITNIGGEREVVTLRDEILPVVRLYDLLGVVDAQKDLCQALLVVVASASGRRHALLVDELLGQHLVVAKALGNGIGRVRGVSGGAILGDGRVGLIIDVNDVLATVGDRAA